MLHIERDAARQLHYKTSSPEAPLTPWTVPLAMAALLHLFLYGAIQISSYTTEEKVGGLVELVQLAHQLPHEEISSRLWENAPPLPWPHFVQEALWELER